MNEFGSSEIVRSHVIVDPLAQGSLRRHAPQIVNDCSVVEEEQCRDSTNTETCSMHGVCIRIDLRNQNFTFLCKVVENGRNGFARSTPFGPKVNKDPFVVVDGAFKLRICDCSYFAHDSTACRRLKNLCRQNHGMPMDIPSLYHIGSVSNTIQWLE